MQTVIDFLSSLERHWDAVAGLSAMLLTWYTTMKAERRKTANEYRELIAQHRKTEIELAQIRAVLAASTGKELNEISVKMVNDMVTNSAHQINELEKFVLTFPRLVWIKKRIGPGEYVMTQVSQCYADLYLDHDPEYYRNKKDSEIWPPAMAEAFAENDEAAFISGMVQEVNERVNSPISGVSGTFVGVKWVFYIDQVPYVCGMGRHEFDEAQPS